MTVIAILAAAVLPGVIDLILTQRSVKEGELCPKLREALKRGILREQVFPIYENDADKLTEGNEAYWWNLAARHGGGSANEVAIRLFAPDFQLHGSSISQKEVGPVRAFRKLLKTD